MILILLVLFSSFIFPLNLEVKLKDSIFPFQLVEELDYKVKGLRISEKEWFIEIWQDLKYSPSSEDYFKVLQETINVKKNLNYDPFIFSQNYEDILKEKKGNCISFVSYLNKRLKNMGFISKEVHGVVFSEKRNSPFYIFNIKATPHRWIKVFFPEFGWLSFDPLSESGRLTNFHLPLKEEKYLPLLKEIKIVVEKWD